MTDYFGPLTRHTCGFLGVVIVVFMGIVTAEGKNPQALQPTAITEAHSTQKSSRYVERNRRDPFQRLHKSGPAPKMFNPPQSAIDSGLQNNSWKLLGVIHGEEGYLAIIQLSPNERVILQPGSELAQSGWMVKTISDNKVLLEQRSPAASGGIFSPQKSLTLSFPSVPSSP